MACPPSACLHPQVCVCVNTWLVWCVCVRKVCVGACVCLCVFVRRPHIPLQPIAHITYVCGKYLLPSQPRWFVIMYPFPCSTAIPVYTHLRMCSQRRSVSNAASLCNHAVSPGHTISTAVSANGRDPCRGRPPLSPASPLLQGNQYARAVCVAREAAAFVWCGAVSGGWAPRASVRGGCV